MKLVSVEVYGKDFRSITANKRYTFNISDRENRLSTKCFAGLNGSGKSNMLELLAEIFYYLEYYHLKQGDHERKRGKGFGFEIEYLKYMDDFEVVDAKGTLLSPWKWVRITKPLENDADEAPVKFAVRSFGSTVDDYVNAAEYGSESFLPNKVIAYTSGQNEMLSNPFYKLRYNYYRELSKEGLEQANDRMFYIDGANNASIFIANLLLAIPQKRQKLEHAFKISELRSFRITVNLHDPAYKPIPFSQATEEILNKLKSCASCWDERFYYGSRKRNQLVLDYFVTPATSEAFAYHFGNSAMSLFQAFYQMETLNIGLQKEKVHKTVHNAKTHLNISDELPHIEADDLVFRIENIVLRKSELNEFGEEILIRYKHLSDGEHQFNEVIGSMMLMEEEGCLLLYDEPDTHFNPEWRSQVIRHFNEVSATSWDKDGNMTSVRNQEVIITTHSPFAISDSYKEDVYCFKKGPYPNAILEIVNPQIPTYGTSIQTILEHVFGNDPTISNMANQELEAIREEAINTKDPRVIQEERSKLIGYGESIEKFDTLRILRERENELKQK